jgi:hypothetical protein
MGPVSQRTGRAAPVRLAVAAAAALVVVGVLAATVTGCSDDDGGGEEGGGDADEVGALETLIEDSELTGAVDLTAGGGVWVALEDGQVLAIDDDRVEPVTPLDDVSIEAGIAAGGDGTLFATDDARQQLLRLQDGSVEPSRLPAVQELSELAAGPDASVYVADFMGLQLVALRPDGAVEELDQNVQAGPMAIAPDGTVYFVSDQLFDGRIMALAPGGEPRALTQEVERDDEGNPLEAPSDGAAAEDLYIDSRDLAAADDGLYVLSFTNEVWRIGDDGELELVLRRGDDAALGALAADGNEVFVLDSGTGTIATLG